jgi:phage-related minor tail protein
MADSPPTKQDLEGVADLANRVAREMTSLTELSEGFGKTLTGALKSAIVDGKSLDAVLRQVANRLSDKALSVALKPLEKLFDGLLGGLLKSIGVTGFAKGGVFRNGAVERFAQGGIVSAPTYFPMGAGVGLMGEAGPEAILPLARGPDGRLGVRTQGGAAGPSIRVDFHVTTPDAPSFLRSEAQVTAMLARAVGRGRRGL